ncbi:MAG: LytR/AlgR family response regulator transcription factor [Pseudomonadales bacterium]
MTSAIIVDDEPNLSAHLQRLLAKHWPALDIVAIGNNGRSALDLVNEHRPDILFLDIRMPPPDGISVARSLTADPAGAPHIVFTTAYDEYAVSAFETAAVDYLLKPITATRLQQTIARLQQQLQSTAKHSSDQLESLLAALKDRTEPVSIESTSYLSWLRAGTGDTTELVAVADVVYFKSDHKYTSAFTADQEHILRMSLKELADQLDPQQFWQIHRSLIVNAGDITSARRDLRGRYTIALRRRKDQIRSSQAYGHLFKQM